MLYSFQCQERRKYTHQPTKKFLRMKMHIKVVPPCIQMTLLMIVRTVRRLFPVFPQNIDDSPNKETSKIREPFHIYIRYVFSFNVNKYMYRVVHFFLNTKKIYQFVMSDCPVSDILL